jgi:hypothetical protein
MKNEMQKFTDEKPILQAKEEELKGVIEEKEN